MEANTLEQILSNASEIQLEQLVYESNDDGMMLYFKTIINNKSYHSKMSIDWSGLNWIIGKYAQLGLDIYDAITSKLFETKDRFREYQFENEITLKQNAEVLAA
jgi:hypothetical protein